MNWIQRIILTLGGAIFVVVAVAEGSDWPEANVWPALASFAAAVFCFVRAAAPSTK